MVHSHSLRIVSIGIFILLSIGSFLFSLYVIWITIFGVGWGGGEIGFFELLWMWKEPILVSFYSAITSIGMIKQKKIASIFGYPISIFFTVGALYDLAIIATSPSRNFSLESFIWWGLFIGISTLVFFGIRSSSTRLNLHESIMMIALTTVLVLSSELIIY